MDSVPYILCWPFAQPSVSRENNTLNEQTSNKYIQQICVEDCDGLQKTNTKKTHTKQQEWKTENKINIVHTLKKRKLVLSGRGAERKSQVWALSLTEFLVQLDEKLTTEKETPYYIMRWTRRFNNQIEKKNQFLCSWKMKDLVIGHSLTRTHIHTRSHSFHHRYIVHELFHPLYKLFHRSLTLALSTHMNDIDASTEKQERNQLFFLKMYQFCTNTHTPPHVCSRLLLDSFIHSIKLKSSTCENMLETVAIKCFGKTIALTINLDHLPQNYWSFCSGFFPTSNFCFENTISSSLLLINRTHMILDLQ